jgi:hypothetical protein
MEPAVTLMVLWLLLMVVVPWARVALPERFSLKHAILVMTAAAVLTAYFVAMMRPQ